MSAVRCIDCGADYSTLGLDVVLSAEQWRLIHPDERGILCGSCIAKRARKLPGAVKLVCRIDIEEAP